MPAVQGRALVGMADVMVDAADDMIARWRGLADTGQPIDIAPEMTILALDVVYRTLFRVKPDFDPVEVYQALSFVLGEIEHRIWSVTSIGAHLPSARNRKFHKYMRYLDRQIAAVIEKRRRDPNQYGDLLSILLAAVDDPENTTYDAKQLRDECMNFTIVGRDTAAGALQWTFYLLSRNPAVERKLRDEIETVLGDRRPIYDDLDRLPYLRMVHDESMRLYPPGWTFSRTALADDRIGGVHIPKGASVQMCVYAMHRNPRYWDNPEGFDPERFLPERAAGRPQFAYFPFGGGGRVCIGRKLAMMEGALIIARILQAFRLNLVPGQRIEIEPMITLRPSGNVGGRGGGRKLVLGSADRADHVDDAAADLWVDDPIIGAHQFQCLALRHQFAGRPAACPGRRVLVGDGGQLVHLVEEIRHRHAEDLTDLIEPAGADAVRAVLVLLHLLER